MKSIDDIKKENPFRVPDGYFDTLTERTMSAVENIPVSESKPAKNHGGKVKIMPFLALAAAIAGFAVLTAGMVKLVTRDSDSNTKQAQNGIYTDLATEEIDTYIIENEWSVPEVVSGGEGEIQSEAIIDYLVLENVELSEIYELL